MKTLHRTPMPVSLILTLIKTHPKATNESYIIFNIIFNIVAETGLEPGCSVGGDFEPEEDYDVVEVRRSSHNTSLPCLPPAPLTIYDVPKCQPVRSRSSWSLEPGLVPPLPSPRKYQTEGRSLPLTPSAPSQAVRRLFDDLEAVEAEEEKVARPKMSPDFSSKTLKPKKSQPESVLGGVEGRFRRKQNV